MPMGALDASDVMAIAALVLLFLLAGVLPITIAFLKGRNWLGVLGIFVASPFAWWAAIRPARPESWWAKDRYTPEQVAEAERLYAPKSGQPLESQPPPPPSPAQQTEYPAGWYDDPWDEGQRRYWDGSEWTTRLDGEDRT